MTTPDPDVQSAVRASSVKVWDAPTRCFHWAIVGLVLCSWVTAVNGWIKWHLWSGATLLTLLVFRLVWGVVGSTTARFAHFVTRPRTAIGYFRSLLGLRQRITYPGHNPAGGWMVIVLLTVLSLQVATGLFANDDVRFNAPLATLISKELSDRVTALHAFLFNGILLLVWVHVVAVGFHFFAAGENVVGPMFTGKKSVAQLPPDAKLRFTHPAIALLLWVVAAGAVGWLIW